MSYFIPEIPVKLKILIESLSKAINLKVSNYPLNRIIDEALRIDLTQNVFDQLLVANTIPRGNSIITADEGIIYNLEQALVVVRLFSLSHIDLTANHLN